MIDRLVKFLLAWLATLLVLLREKVWRYLRQFVIKFARWAIQSLIKFLEELLKRLHFFKLGR